MDKYCCVKMRWKSIGDFFPSLHQSVVLPSILALVIDWELVKLCYFPPLLSLLLTAVVHTLFVLEFLRVNGHLTIYTYLGQISFYLSACSMYFVGALY